jgi:NAD(P)-dependent dehydrogenase (short-subunit alcohol dehydrogenase family)
MNELAGKVALVTGASRGIGQAIAETFAREGARVIICGRKQETLDAVAKNSPNIVPVVCHVGRVDEINRVVEQAGTVDILVNNAGTNIAQGPCLTFTDAQFDKMVEINLKSAYRFIQCLAPQMCDRGSGSIINIASVAGIKPQFESLLYSMTKAALIMMTQSYAVELGRCGVRVNAIAPGLIETQLSEYFWKDQARRSEFMKRQPIGRIGQPQEIADVALTLASDKSSYLTGQTIVVDGGVTLC